VRNEVVGVTDDAERQECRTANCGDAEQPGAPDPDDYRIPTIDELDAMRVAAGLSMKDLSDCAGFKSNRFSHILNNDTNPQTRTIRAFLTALREFDGHSPSGEQGPDPERSEQVNDDSDGPTEVDIDQIAARLARLDPDVLGEDPTPPDTDENLLTDGGRCSDDIERLEDHIGRRGNFGQINAALGIYSVTQTIVGRAADVGCPQCVLNPIVSRCLLVLRAFISVAVGHRDTGFDTTGELLDLRRPPAAVVVGVVRPDQFRFPLERALDVVGLKVRLGGYGEQDTHRVKPTPLLEVEEQPGGGLPAGVGGGGQPVVVRQVAASSVEMVGRFERALRKFVAEAVWLVHMPYQAALCVKTLGFDTVAEGRSGKLAQKVREFISVSSRQNGRYQEPDVDR
jgi:transcriptional regulator with XRE-family HTH domain